MDKSHINSHYLVWVISQYDMIIQIANSFYFSFNHQMHFFVWQEDIYK